MLIVSGTISVEPSDHDAFLALTVPLVEATLAEDGNLTYGFYPQPGNPGAFRVYEEWEDRAAMDAHMAQPHMAEFIGAMGQLAVTGVEINVHEVASSSRLM